MNKEIQQLIMDVMDGNPGALTIIRKLMLSSNWFQVLYHLKNQGVVGSELWRVVKDDYDHDHARFIDDQLAQMQPDRAQALRSLAQQQSVQNN